jgi:O-antigen/teichoic acid export membrane protein
MLRSLTLRTFVFNSNIVLLGLGASILLSRWLGPEGRGEVAAAMLWPTLLVYFSSIGLISSTLYFAALPDAKTEKVFANAMLIAGLQSLIVLLLGYIALPRLLSSQTAVVVNLSRLYLLVIPLSLATQYGLSILQGRMHISSFNRLRAVIPLGYLLGLLAFKAAGVLSLKAIILLHLVFNAVGLMLTFFTLLRMKIRLSLRPDIDLARQMIRYGLKVYLGDVSQGMNLRLDQMMMAAWLPPVQLGLYVVAVSSASLPQQILSGAVRTVISPAITQNRSDEKRAVMLQELFRKYLLASFLITIVSGACLPLLIPLVYGRDFIGATWPAEVLVGGALLIGAKEVLSAGAQAFGNPWLSSRAEILSSAVTVLLLLVLLPRWGIFGAAVASLLAYGAQLVVVVYGLRHSHAISPIKLFRVKSKDVDSLLSTVWLGGANLAEALKLR